ncbi:MAG: hypothetical protein ACR2PL_02490, partial [Dehalococcoidia bacterium]
MNIRGSSPEVEPRKRRRIELARRTCIIDAERIRIRPSPATLVPPLFGFLFGGLCFALLLADILVWPNFLPFALLAILLIFSLFSLPLSGMGLIYAAIGANVVIDQQKQSATWQQGLLGLGVGTTELVPFWKIEAIAVEETGSGEGRTTEEFAQWEIMLIKKSGRRLTIGRVSTARSLATPSLGRALEVAHAVAELTGAPLRLPGTTAKDQIGEPTGETMRALTRSEVSASSVSL